MAGLSTKSYSQHLKEQKERERKEFGEQKAALRRHFQQLPLNALFKQVAIKLLDLSYVDRICDPSMEFLGTALSRHPKVVARHIKAIEDIGLFEIERRKARGKNLSNRYTVNFDCKVWYLTKHPDYHHPQGQAVVAKLQEIIRRHTQTNLVAAKTRGTVARVSSVEPCGPPSTVSEEPYGSLEQEPYTPHQGTARFQKLPPERGHHGRDAVVVPEPLDLSTIRADHVEVLSDDAAAPHQYPLASCEAAAQPQSSDRVLRTFISSVARDGENVLATVVEPKQSTLTSYDVDAIRKSLASYELGDDID